MDDGIHAEKLVGAYTEITPARPTIAHHRHPYDNVKKSIDGKKNSTQTVLHTMIITAAEQQTMNFYMNQAACYENDLGRRLFEEICLVEEEHVTQYGSLIDSSPDFFECLLWHEYTECYLYWSNYETETDKEIKKIWEYYFEAELSHLNTARKLLKKYRKKERLRRSNCRFRLSRSLIAPPKYRIRKGYHFDDGTVYGQRRRLYQHFRTRQQGEILRLQHKDNRSPKGRCRTRNCFEIY
ncbi:MAG: hypothetical protein MJ072_06815 [Clostridia bacterium]|nr:hypothetical protein [Clostridia bacterium]